MGKYSIQYIKPGAGGFATSNFEFDADTSKFHVNATMDLGTRTASTARSISTGGSETGLNVGVVYDADGVANTTDYIGSAAIFNYIHNLECKSGGTSSPGMATIWANVEIDEQLYGSGGMSAGWFTIWADATGDAAHVRSSAGARAYHLQAIDAAIVTGSAFDLGANCDLFGVRVDSSVHASATMSGHFYGISIAKSSGKKDWQIGVDINNSTIGMEIGACTDGILVSGACGDNAIEITGVATGAAMLVDYTIAAAATRAIKVDMDTSASSGDLTVVDIDLTVSVAGTVNDRALTSDLTMGANCSGPYAAYFRTDCVTYQVLGLGAALGIELCLPGATCSSGEFHGMTIDLECPTSFSLSAGKHSFIKLETWGNTESVWDDAGNILFLNGLTAGAGNIISADSNTLRMNISGTSYYIPLSATENVFDFDMTSTASSGDLNVVDIDLTVGVAGTVNDRALTSDLTMGANCSGPYAAYFRTDCVSYQVLGLGAALGIELCLPGATCSSGEFHGMTIDLECPTSFSLGAGKHSFIKLETWGDTESVWDDAGNILFLNGLTAGAGNIISADNNTLRINISGTSYYLPLSTTENSLVYTSGLNTSDDDISLIEIGSYDTAYAITSAITANTFPLSVHIDNQINSTGSCWLTGIYSKVKLSTATNSSVSAVPIMVRVDIQQACAAFYGIQSHVKFTAGTAQDVSSEVIGISAQIYGAAAAGTGLHWGVKSDLRHTNCPSGAGHTSACYFGVATVDISCGMYLEALGSKTMYSGIYLHGAGTITNGIECNGAVTNFANFNNSTDGSPFTKNNTAKSGTCSGWIKVIDQDGTAGYVNVYTN